MPVAPDAAGLHSFDDETRRLRLSEAMPSHSRDFQAGALDAHTAMSTQALNSEHVRAGIKDILLNHAELYEALRRKAAV